MSRFGPNDSKATSRKGRICSGSQSVQSASVTNPESLQHRLEQSASLLIPFAQASMLPLLMGGLAK